MKKLRRLALAGCLAAALAAAGCVSTQDIEALQAQLSDIQRQMLQMQKLAPSKQEVADLESNVGRQMQSLLRTEADMQVKLQDLSNQIEALQAKLEDTNYRLAQLSQQIAATNQELKAFRSQSAVPAPAPDGSTPPEPPPPGGGADPQGLYDAAYNDYLKGNYDLARRSFQEYLDNFPNTDLSDNATYWIGETYYRQKRFRQAIDQFAAVLSRYPRSDKVPSAELKKGYAHIELGETYYRQKRFRQAIDQFDAVLSRYPRSDKVPSALLKKGYSHLELGERPQGVVQLQHVIRQFPTSDEANLARQRLRELGVDVG